MLVCVAVIDSGSPNLPIEMDEAKIPDRTFVTCRERPAGDWIVTKRISTSYQA
jgi:hypothetical protein